MGRTAFMRWLLVTDNHCPLNANRWLGFRVAYADARCEQPRCRGVSAAGKTRRACRAPCGAGRGEHHHMVGLTWIVGQHLATSLKVADVTVGLSFAPGTEGYNRRCSAGRSRHGAKNEAWHGLAPCQGKLELLPDASKRVALWLSRWRHLRRWPPVARPASPRTALPRAPKSAALRAPPRWRSRSARSQPW